MQESRAQATLGSEVSIGNDCVRPAGRRVEQPTGRRPGTGRYVMITGDFLGMSMTTDNVQPSPLPNKWQTNKLTIAGIFMGASELVFCIVVLAIGHLVWGLSMRVLQTLAFFTLVCGNQATTYAVRPRHSLYALPHPSLLLAISSIVDLSIAFLLAERGWLMAPAPLTLLGWVLAGATIFAMIVDRVKLKVFAKFKIC